MKVFNYLQKVKLKNPTFILGAFETIHKGHLELIKKGIEVKNGDLVLCIIKDPSLIPGKTGEIFEQLEVRLQKMTNLKIDYVMVIDFSMKFRKTKASDFIDSLIKEYQVENLVVGKDYHLGINAEWGTGELKNHFHNTYIVEALKVRGKKISTSIIKEQIPFGELNFANQLIMQDWMTQNRIGKNNEIMWPDKLVKPHSGMYVVHFVLDDLMYHTLVRVTLNGNFEVRFLDSEDNFQNKVGFFIWRSKLKTTIKNTEDVIKESDIKMAKEYFKNKL